MKKLISVFFLAMFLLVGCTTTNNNDNTYTLPDLSNKTKEEVQTILDDVPFTIIMHDIDSDDVEGGLFVEYGNNLQANDTINYGEQVYIYFSKVAEQITLPDLTGKSLTQIGFIMDDYDLDINYNNIDSETVRNHYFISYGNNLEAFDSVDDGSSITINISREVVSLPDLTGKSLNEIKDIMKDYNLQIQYNDIKSEDVMDGIFLSYGDNLTAGSKLRLTSHVVINVSQYTGPMELPDLTGLNQLEIELELGSNFEVIYKNQIDSTIPHGEFIRYRDYSAHDSIPNGSTIYVIISLGVSEFYKTQYLEYDGPRLDASFTNVDPVDPRGGYFEVPLTQCVDGDTAKFDYPTYIDNIIGETQSIRFLNMDTEESTKEKEEWGKPASNYTCDMLTNAESIVLQTDPGDNLTGTYGRLLSWVWIIPEDTPLKAGETDYTLDQYQLLNYKIMQQGLAQVKYLFGAGSITYNGTSYTDWMYQAEDYAQDHQLGQWGELLDPYWDYENNQPKGW